MVIAEVVVLMLLQIVLVHASPWSPRALAEDHGQCRICTPGWARSLEGYGIQNDS